MSFCTEYGIADVTVCLHTPRELQLAVSFRPFVGSAGGETVDVYFREVDHLFRQAQAAQPVEEDELFAPTLQALMENPQRRQDLGQRAKALVEKHRGAIDRTLDLLDSLP